MLAICGAAYGLNVWLLQTTGALFRDYFNDLLAGAILLAYASVITPAGTVVARYVASVPGAISIIGFAAIVWEVLAPRLLQNSTGDPLDIVAYVVGGATYQIVAHIYRSGDGADPLLEPVRD